MLMSFLEKILLGYRQKGELFVSMRVLGGENKNPGFPGFLGFHFRFTSGFLGHF